MKKTKIYLLWAKLRSNLFSKCQKEVKVVEFSFILSTFAHSYEKIISNR